MAPPQAPFTDATHQDDDMEISSDAGRLEHDNDIDLVDGDDDFDYMLEDTRSDQGQPRVDDIPEPSRDDIMYDDFDEITYVEDTMHDDAPGPDEHLSDVSEIHEDANLDQFVQGENVDVETTSTSADLAESSDTAHVQQVSDSEALLDTVDYYEPEVQEKDVSANTITTDDEILASEAVPNAPELEGFVEEQEQEQVDVPTYFGNNRHESLLPTDQTYDGEGRPTEPVVDDTEQLSEPVAPLVHQTSPEHVSSDQQSPTGSVRHERGSPQRSGSQQPDILTKNETAPSPVPSIKSDPIEVQAASQHASHDDPPQSENVNDESEPNSMHSVVVDYEGTHVSLFPPMEGDEADMFLLKDSFLADKTLVELFRACRQVLGESIDEATELEIYSEDLDLTIAEDSVHCMTTSFSQLIDVYVTLSQQDGIEHPEPFFISLTKKPRFSSRLSALYVAASETKGLSAMQPEEYSEQAPEANEEDHHDFSNETMTRAPKITDVQWEALEGQKTSAPNATDQEPAESGFDATFDEAAEGTEVNEPNPEDDDAIRETEGNDEGLQEGIEQHTSSKEYDDLQEAESQVEANPQIEVPTEDNSLDHSGSAENRDDESSGSSTVQGEDDAQQNYTVYEGSAEDLPPISEVDEEKPFTAYLDTEAQYIEAAPADNAGRQNAVGDYEENEIASGEFHAQDEEGSFIDPETYFNNDQDEQEFVEHDYDQGHEDEQEPDESSKHIHENEWATLDEELDFEVGTEQQNEQAASVPLADFPASSGTFRVPDDSAEDEDDDSITYDDEKLDLSPQPETNTVQARPSSQYPLGKRSRDDDEGGGDGSSDQELKRLKSS